MAIMGRPNIESVSQAMFLTVLALGLTKGDLIQDASLYRQATVAFRTFPATTRIFSMVVPSRAVLANNSTTITGAPQFVNEITKTTEEYFPIGLDFTPSLPPNTSVRSATVVAVDDVNGGVVTAQIVENATASVTTNVASVNVKNGIIGAIYRLKYLATLTSGFLIRADVRLTVTVNAS